MNKLSLVSAVALCAGMLFGSTTPDGWTDDYNAALKRAKAEKKLVLVNFSSSDCCYWSKRLNKEVLTTDSFKKAADEKYVLLFIDNPKDKSGLSNKTINDNWDLARKYNVTEYPTVFLLTDIGEVVAETGYKDGGPNKYLAHLETITKEGLANLAIRPIEHLLNTPTQNMNHELETPSIQAKIDEKLPRPDASATPEELKAYERKANILAAVLSIEIADKYIPIINKAIAEAKATPIDAEYEARKNELIANQEKTLEMIKKMREWIKSQFPPEVLEGGSGL